jgi:GntR family transcriptional regulator
MDRERSGQVAQPWVPLYRQIHSTLRERIVSGQYRIASYLPTEVELCAEFKASRFTVREALRALTEQGFVQRRPRAGTIVLTDEPQVTYSQSVRTVEDLSQIATTTHWVMLGKAEVTLDERLAVRIGAQAGETWIQVDGVRWDKPGGVPLCYVQSYVPGRLAAVVDEFPGLNAPFYELLERRSGETIEEVTQEINALTMPDPIVRALGLEPGSFALRVLRRYATRQSTLITSLNWHRADQFTYRMQLQRNSDRGAGRSRSRKRG